MHYCKKGRYYNAGLRGSFRIAFLIGLDIFSLPLLNLENTKYCFGRQLFFTFLYSSIRTPVTCLMLRIRRSVQPPENYI